MATFATDKFQGTCLVNEDGAGAKYMYDFDQFPKNIRKRISESPFNLCCACVEMYSQSFEGGNLVSDRSYLKVIEMMEGKARGLQGNDRGP